MSQGVLSTRASARDTRRGRTILEPRPSFARFDQLPPGLYLARQRSSEKGVAHAGILDIGNRLQFEWNTAQRAVVAHQTPPTLRTDWADNTGQWELLARIVDEECALARVRAATTAPYYDLFGNNCEHFARFVATGRRESPQLQGAFVIATFAAIALFAT